MLTCFPSQETLLKMFVFWCGHSLRVALWTGPNILGFYSGFYKLWWQKNLKRRAAVTNWGCLKMWKWRDHFDWRERKDKKDGENSVTEEFCNLCSLPNSTRAIKSRKVRWTRCIASMWDVRKCIQDFGQQNWKKETTWKN